MVKRPEEWKWSSYAYNAYGEEDKLINQVTCTIPFDKGWVRGNKIMTLH